MISFPSVVFDLPDAEYRAVDALSKHTLDWLAESPATFIENTQHPPERTPAMRFGTLVDIRFLDPVGWAAVRQAPDADHRSNKWKDFAALCDAEGVEYADTEEREKIESMHDAMRRNPVFSQLIDKSKHQVSLFWIDEETGLRLKGRADMVLMTDGPRDIMPDLKTAEEASPFAFRRAAGNFRYHMQAAMYLDGWKANTARDADFLFSVIEKEPPFLNTVYPLGAMSIDAGRNEYHRLLRLYKQCSERDEWPGLPNISDEFDVPDWNM